MQNQRMIESLRHVDEDTTLCHYGVLGMKWGVRRYQPYPNDYSGEGVYKPSRKERRRQAKNEKRAAKFNAKKQKAIDSLDLKAIRKHPEWFSSEDLNPVVDKSGKIKSATSNMSTIRGEEYLKTANMMNQGLQVVRNSVGIVAAGAAAALAIINVRDKLSKK